MGKGRPTYISQVAEALEDAVETLGDLKAKGQDAQELSRIYQRLMACRSRVQFIWDADTSRERLGRVIRD